MTRRWLTWPVLTLEMASPRGAADVSSSDRISIRRDPLSSPTNSLFPLRAVKTKRYHMGIRSGISRNNLSNANQTRDWRIYADFAQVLIGQARVLYAEEDLGIDLQATVYALDASTIDLCLSMFPWAKFRKAKGAVKIHTLLNLQGSIPEFILISDGKLHDVNALDYLIPMPGAYYVMDRGYLDFGRLYQLHQAKAYFVTRAKKNFAFKRRYSHAVDKATGVQCDQTIVLETFYSSQRYPEPLRRIRYYDESLGVDIPTQTTCIYEAACDTFAILECDHAYGLPE